MTTHRFSFPDVERALHEARECADQVRAAHPQAAAAIETLAQIVRQFGGLAPKDRVSEEALREKFAARKRAMGLSNTPQQKAVTTRSVIAEALHPNFWTKETK